MNFDRISFRTTPEETAFLENANQQYRCRSVTSLMHKVLAEFMSKYSLKPKTMHDNPPIKVNEEKLLMKDTRLEAITAVQKVPYSEEVTNILTNPYLDAFREIIWLEQAKRELERLRNMSR